MEGDDADVEYRLPPFKVLLRKDGKMTTVPWWDVPCEGANRCWLPWGGYCHFLHDDNDGKVVAAGTEEQCNRYRRVRIHGQLGKDPDNNSHEASLNQ